jgi:glycolate oxidase
VKGVAGLDLAGLMVGSEGTLGIVTMARLRLRPLPPPATTAVAVFDDIGKAGRAVAAVMERMTPSMLEIMDRTTINAVESWRPMGLDTSAETILIAQSDAGGDVGTAEAALLLRLCEEHGAVETYQSEDPEQAELLLGARRMAIPALEAQGDWLLDDVAVPRSALADAMVRIADLAQECDVLIGTFGHAGDGNLHPTIVVPRQDADAAARAMTAFDGILQIALDLGGTVTGEHGVGTLKLAALRDELDDGAIALHHRIKEALDPLGILNPGKSIPRW